MADDLPPDDPGDAEDPGDPTRRLFERPLVWLAVLIAGVVVAVSLSFVAEKTDVSGTPGDVGHYCGQVAVIKRTSPLLLGNGAPGNLDQAASYVWQLSALERVAPETVRDDVQEVLQAARDVYSALQATDPSSPAGAKELAITVARAESRSEDAIALMKEYTQEACGVDLTPSTTTSTTSTTPN
jgi:hypothetical protein